MKSEKKEYVILSDVIAMDEMDAAEKKEESVEMKKQKEDPKKAVKAEDTAEDKKVEEKNQVVVSTEDKKKENKTPKSKKNKKTRKKEKQEKREAIKAIKAETSAEIAAAQLKHRVESEEEKAEVKELLKAEMNATKAEIQELMKSETKEEKTEIKAAVLRETIKTEDCAVVPETESKVVESDQAEVPKEHKSLKELLRNTKFLLGSLVAILVLIIYCSVAYNYREAFFMRTTINGIDCAGMTAKEAEAALKEKVEDYELEITFRDGTKEIISGESINYKYVSDGSVKKLMDKQLSFLWLFYLVFPAEHEVPECIEFDRGLLAQEYYALQSTAAEKNVAPTNAYVTYEGDKFIVVPEDEGNQIDHHAFILEINKVVAASGTQIVAQDYDIYARPTVFRDSADLAKECEQLNELAVVSVTYTLANGEYVMDGNEVRNWLKVDEQGNYSITEEEMAQAIEDFVDRLADEVNTIGTERPFKATKQGDITVSGGTYGWKINKKEEIAKLTEEIANRAIVTREPCYSSREVTADNNGFGDTYIEIDLTNQHLWYYIDGELYVESDFVSGTYHNASRRTPGGIFLLTYKQKDRVLRGEQKEDGTYEYESPVSFWMPFNRGIGLHDASWRGSFGGTIYKYSGSHGCINLPYKKAQAIYSEIDKETPIICFY